MHAQHATQCEGVCLGGPGLRGYDKYFAADSKRGPRGLNDNMHKVAAATFFEGVCSTRSEKRSAKRR